MNNFSEKVSFIWGVADLLRGDYKQSEYGRVILPFIVLRRLDQVLALTREAVWAADDKSRNLPEALREKMLMKAAGVGFYNTSRLDFPKLLQDPNNVAANLTGFLHGFSANVRDIMERFRFESQITRLDGADLLFLVARKFVEIDLHPYQRNPDGSIAKGPDGQPEPNVTNHEMGYIFEELIRRFSEQSNETAGEHFTPREVIRFMVNLLFAEDDEALHQPGIVRKMYDPACGTGGMLSVAEDYLGRAQPPGPPPGLRPGAERRVLRHLQGRHADQGPGGRQHQVRQLLHRRRTARPQGRLPASAIRPSAWTGPRPRRPCATSTRPAATPGASVPGCRARTTARCSSCCTC